MIPAGELKVQRALTAVFIAADQIPVALTRRTQIPDGKGGYRLTEQKLAPQVFRLIPSQDGSAERTTADGKAVTPEYVLMGTHLADMARGDTFTVGDRRYEVVFINENQQYEIKGEVSYRGRI